MDDWGQARMLLTLGGLLQGDWGSEPEGRIDWTGEVMGWHPGAAPQQAAGFERQQGCTQSGSPTTGAERNGEAES